jgi:hypothetical protein
LEPGIVATNTSGFLGFSTRASAASTFSAGMYAATGFASSVFRAFYMASAMRASRCVFSRACRASAELGA